MSDTLQFVVVMRHGLAAMLLESSASQRLRFHPVIHAKELTARFGST